MSQTSGFFDSVYSEETGSYDREYYSSQFAEFFSRFIKNGVFSSPTNQLKVSASGGMSLSVSSGWAFINGYWFKMDSEEVFTVDSNSSSSSRVDSILCRWDRSKRAIGLIYQKGSTQVLRNNSYYDLKLAEITVPSKASSISPSNVKDTRPNDSACGFVTGLLKIETTQDLFDQFESMFYAWFQPLKDQVTGDLGMHLQQEVNVLTGDVEALKQRMNIQLSRTEPTTIPNNTVVFVYED